MTRKSTRKRSKRIADRTPPEAPPAAELIANNVEILTLILLLIPAKSLIRFKSVSKPWLTLLSDSQFASSHSRLNPNPPISSLYFYYESGIDLGSVSLNGSPTFPSLSFVRRRRRLTGDFTILHSCNGLLLIKNSRIVGRLVKERYIVCNPTTQKFRLLTQPGGDFYASGCLAFDPSKSPHYKVVLSVRSPYLDIYSSETACWKKIFLVNRCYGDGAFWNGAIYWLCDRNNHHLLLRFDVETEKMVGIQYVQSGSGILYPDTTRYFGECGRGARLVLIQSHSRSLVFEIHEMDKDYCRWNFKLRVSLWPLISAFRTFPEIESRNDVFTVMCVVEGEKEDDLALILAVPGKVISYNLQKKTWNVLHDLASGEFINVAYTCAFPFRESLFPV